VELLVVIGIIGLLAAIITPVVMQSLTKARNAAIKAEIDMLHMAIMNYKNEYGSFPPAISTANVGDLAAKHLSRLFPRCPKDSTVNSGTNVPQQLLAAFPATASPKALTSINAITYWLSGFSDDPIQPLAGTRKKLFDFDMARVEQVTGAYFPSGKSSSAYRYINAGLYSGNQYSGTTEAQLSNYGVQCIPPKLLPTKPSAATPDAWYFTTAASSPSTPQPFNADSFQILCAGRDEQFGTDDDLSNFWPGTRREYLDSLKD
jgi:type II secretory pathway pseudopilin PulG